MGPDLLYFLPVSNTVDRKYGHELPGLILFSIPAAIILWLLWRWWLRDAVIALLPTEEQQKWVANEQPFEWSSARAWVLIVIAVVIGVVSHIFLDGISHRDGWGVEHIGLLTQTSFRLANRDLAVYKLLQYFGSLVGLGILAAWYLWWSEHVHRDRTWKPQFSRTFRAAVIVAIAAVAAYASYRAAILYRPDERPEQLAAAIIASTQVAFIGLFVVGLLVKLRQGAFGTSSG